MAARRRVAGRPPTPAGMLLAPGAGSSSTHPALVAVEQAVAPLAVRRMDFPYRLAGRRAPDRAPVLLAALRAAAEALAADVGAPTSRLVLGGRSMGGRMCSMLAAGGPDSGEALPVAGLVLISYPLHPPGRPDKLRTEHLPRLGVPCLFLHGTKDAFGTPEELAAHSAVIPGPVTHVWIEGGTHELKRSDARVAEETAAWLASTFV